MAKSSPPFTMSSFSKVDHIQRGGTIHTLTHIPTQSSPSVPSACETEIKGFNHNFRTGSKWTDLRVSRHLKGPSRNIGRSFLRSLFFTNHCYYYIKLLLIILKLLVLYYYITILLKILENIRFSLTLLQYPECQKNLKWKCLHLILAVTLSEIFLKISQLIRMVF